MNRPRPLPDCSRRRAKRAAKRRLRNRSRKSRPLPRQKRLRPQKRRRKRRPRPFPQQKRLRRQKRRRKRRPRLLPPPKRHRRQNPQPENPRPAKQPANVNNFATPRLAERATKNNVRSAAAGLILRKLPKSAHERKIKWQIQMQSWSNSAA